MLLYHYTAVQRLEAICREGITKGELPLSQTNAPKGFPWFTTDSSSAGHGVPAAGELTREMIVQRKRLGLLPADTPEDVPLQTLSKRTARITVRIPSTDRDLVHWMTWGAKHLDRAWFETLNRAGGDSESKSRAKTWYFTRRPVLPHEFVAVERLGEDGRWEVAATWSPAN